MIIGNSKPVPSVFGTQYPGAIPCGTKIPVKRVLGTAAVLLRAVCAGTIESRKGNAKAMPAPRRKARLGTCFLVRNIAFTLLDIHHRSTFPAPNRHYRAARCSAPCDFIFI